MSLAGPLLSGTAFITGGASGIGQAIAVAFVTHGITKLTLTDRNSNSTTADLVRKVNPDVEILEIILDVTDEQGIIDAVQETKKKYGRIDVAVNAAGIGNLAKSHETSLAEWRKVMDINIDGVFLCQREQLKVMLEQGYVLLNVPCPRLSSRPSLTITFRDLGPRIGRGAIINISSMAGILGGPTAPYGSAKHAVLGLTKGDARDYGKYGIKINALCPGWIKTPLTAPINAMGGEIVAGVLKHTPIGRMGEPEEMADCCVFLASKLSSFVTGIGLAADGGFQLG
jgi:NAD(P)-dependent dehydrogenase (short-subunit alcohol dehydrogenase family)